MAPAAYLLNVDADKLLAEGEGYAALGMIEAAAIALDAVPESSLGAYLRAQAILIELEISRRQFRRAADRGRVLILAETYDIPIVIKTMAALAFLGEASEGRDVLGLVERFGRPLECHAYQMACFESMLGNYPEALRWLARELRQPQFFAGRSIADADLLPLWTWLATGRLSLADAHCLFSFWYRPLFRDAIAAPPSAAVDFNAIAGFPLEFHKLFRHDPRVGLCEIDATSAGAHPLLIQEFTRYRETELRRTKALLYAGYSQSLKRILAEQPTYAAAQAASGNHFGARFHITWALWQDVDMLGAFYAEPGLEPMRAFLDSFAKVIERDLFFCARVEAAGQMIVTNVEEAGMLLEETPPWSRSHPLYILRRSNLDFAEHAYDAALAASLRLCDLWPDDVVGFANACHALCVLGRWNEARDVFNRAPACYARFHLYDAQRTNLVNRNMKAVAQPPTVFRGQPDLGGY